MEEYRVQLGEYLFKLVVKEEKKGNLRFSIGSTRKETPCAVITYKPKISFQVNLTGLEYDVMCSDGVDLERRKGTRAMALVLVLIVLKALPNVSIVTLDDFSNIDCYGYLMNLNDFKFLTEGRTYYQSLIPDLHPASDDADKKLEQNTAWLHSKLHLPFKNFWEICIRDAAGDGLEYLSSIKKQLRKVYSEEVGNMGTYATFFNKLISDNHIDCKFFLYTMHNYEPLGYESLSMMTWNAGRSSFEKLRSVTPYKATKILEEPRDFETQTWQGGAKQSEEDKWNNHLHRYYAVPKFDSDADWQPRQYLGVWSRDDPI